LLDHAQFFAVHNGRGLTRGYASGWAAHKFRERVSIWPDHPLVRNVEAMPPSLNTKN
jgi:hypothetical protein